MATKKRKKKEKLSTRIWNWCERHDIDEVDLLIWGSMGVSAIFGGVVGYLGGRYDGTYKGYKKGISNATETYEAALDAFAQAGSDATMGVLYEDFGAEFKNMIESKHTTESFSKAVRGKYDSNEGVQLVKASTKSLKEWSKKK